MLVFRFDEPYLKGNRPTKGQRKTLTRVGIEPTTFGLDHIRREQVMGIEECQIHDNEHVQIQGVTFIQTLAV